MRFWSKAEIQKTGPLKGSRKWLVIGGGGRRRMHTHYTETRGGWDWLISVDFFAV